MAFRFQLDEPFSKGFKRIALQQIDKAEQQLSSAHAEATAVHEMRKAMKRLRALYRLVRPVIGEAAYQRENARFRAAAGHLSGTRDQQVLLETLTKLEAAESKPSRAFAEARKAIAATNGTAPAVDAVKAALDLLQAGRKALKQIKIEDEGFDLVRSGFERCYGQGRKNMAAAYADPHDEAFHEWRKTVQRHWRHMALLEAAWPDAVNARVELARHLSQLLGNDHDLAVLKATAGERMDAATARQIEKSARVAQQRIRNEARSLGEQLYFEKPDALGERLACYWEAAREHSRYNDAARHENGKPHKKAADKNKKNVAKKTDAPAAKNPGNGSRQASTKGK